MKIKIVIYSPLHETGGGRETWLQYFMRHLLNENYQLEVFCLEDDFPNSIDMKQEFQNVLFVKCNFYKDNKFNFLNFIKTMKQELALRHQEDTVYLFLGTVIEGAALINLKKQISNARCFLWTRSINSNEIMHRHNRLFSMIPKYIENKAIEKSNQVITNGYDTFEFYKKAYRLKDKCCAIPNAVEIQKFSFPYFSLKDNPCKFLYLGRFCEAKGVYDILKAFNMLDIKEDYSCYFYGHGDELHSYIKNSHCEMKEEIKRDQIISVYSKTNVSLFLGKGAEYGGGGISHSLLEALASGHICLCYDITAYNQIIQSGFNGILIDYLNVEAVMHCIRDLIINKSSDFYKDIQENARLTAKNYSVDNHILKFQNLITTKVGNL